MRNHTWHGASAAALAGCAIAAGHAWADQSSPTILVYAPKGTGTAQYRVWNGSSWSAAASMPSIGEEGWWVVARNCPTRNETACAILDKDQRLYLTFFDGTSWSSPQTLASEVGDSKDGRAFDLAYEESGDFLIAYWDEDDDAVRYRTASGGGASGEATVSFSGIEEVSWLRLHSRPGSDHVMLLASDEDKDLYGAVWTGSSWTSAMRLGSSLRSKSTECWTGVFEAKSGEGLVVYSHSSSGVIRYRTLTGTTWSDEQTGPNMGGNKLQWMQSAANPANNSIMLVVLDDDKKLYSCLWSGSAWGEPEHIASSLKHDNRANYDVAYQPDGAKALLVHAQSSSSVIKHRVWSGSAWGATLNGSSTGDDNDLFAAFTGRAGGDIFVANIDSGEDLNFAHWDGSTLGSHVQLHGSVAGSKQTLSMSISVPRSVEAEEEDPGPAPKRVTRWQEVNPR